MTDDTNTAEGIWIEQSGGLPRRIAFEEEELASTTNYTRQGCLPAQGESNVQPVPVDTLVSVPDLSLPPPVLQAVTTSTT